MVYFENLHNKAFLLPSINYGWCIVNVIIFLAKEIWMLIK